MSMCFCEDNTQGDHEVSFSCQEREAEQEEQKRRQRIKTRNLELKSEKQEFGCTVALVWAAG